MHNFLGDDVFDPGTVSILMAAFDSAWQSIKASGAQLSEKQSELVRETLAKYIIEQARHGELDQVARGRNGGIRQELAAAVKKARAVPRLSRRPIRFGLGRNVT